MNRIGFFVVVKGPVVVVIAVAVIVVLALGPWLARRRKMP